MPSAWERRGQPRSPWAVEVEAVVAVVARAEGLLLRVALDRIRRPIRRIRY